MESALLLPAFFAGLATFFAPCTFPLVPAYLGYLGGSLGAPAEAKRGAAYAANALLFVAGFTFVFVMMGTAAGAAGSALVRHRDVLTRIGGVIVLLFGLAFLGFFDPAKLPFFGARGGTAGHGRKLGSFAFGAAFAFGWTPCVGPVLGSILLLAASTTTAWTGAVLLLVFSAGLAVPFLAIAWSAERAAARVRAISRHLSRISAASGVLLVLLGAVMITGEYALWARFFGILAEFFGLENFARWT